MDHRRRPTVLWAIAVVAVCLTAWLCWRAAVGSHPTVPPGESPFLDLHAVVARYRSGGWEVSALPRLPGPYREDRRFGGAVLGGGSPDHTMKSQVRDDRGAVLEGVSLAARPDCDQMILRLETEAGAKTLVVLTRGW